MLLWNSHLSHTKKGVRKQEELQRLQNLRSKADESDNASVRSSSTTPSVATAVDSEAPNTGKTPDNDEGKIGDIDFLVPYVCFPKLLLKSRFMAQS